MWAQIIKTRLKPDGEDKVKEVLAQLQSIEQADSGLLRSTAMVDQHDPTQLYLMVVFSSEEQARAREQDPRRAEGLERVRALMAEMIDGAPEFLDLDVIEDVVR